MVRYFSMFSGIGGFEYGIRQSTEESECVGYSEIDKHAITIYEKHFGGHKNYGDATKIKPELLPDFDFLVGGFPCQAFSVAGNRRGFFDTRGTLFFEIARIVKRKQPRIVLLENVKGLLSHDRGKTFTTILQTIDELGYDAQWQVLNSKHFGVPQSRERVFIIGYLRGSSGRQVFPLRSPIRENSEKTEGLCATTLLAGYYKGGSGNHIKYDQKGNQHRRIYNPTGVSPTLIGGSKLAGEVTPKIAIPEATKKGYATDEVGDSINLSVMNSKTRRGRVGKGIAQTLDTGMMQHTLSGARIRRLTPIECERLQGFPDNWTQGLSDTQRYKCLGNAVTTNVIEAIVREIDFG